MTQPKTQLTPTLPLTVAQASALWGLHPSRVKVLIEQGRVKHRKIGGGEERAGGILIDQLERPPRAKRGELTKAQRAVFKAKGKR